MKDLMQRFARGATVLLAASMLLVAVVKAQGCKNDDAMLPGTKVGVLRGELTFEAEPAVATDAGGDDAGGADTGSDAAVEAAVPRMVPATKSGVFMGFEPSDPGAGELQQLQPPQQQRQQNANPR